MYLRKYLIIIFILALFTGNTFAGEGEEIPVNENTDTSEAVQAQNSKLLFLYGVGAFNIANNSATALLGLRLSYFLREADKKFNFGLSLQFAYLNATVGEEDNTGKFQYCSQKYLSTDLLVNLKIIGISELHSFNLGVGFSLAYHIKGDKIFSVGSNTWEYKDIVPSILLEIGYLFHTRNRKFTFFVNFNYRVLPKGFFNYFLSGIKESGYKVEYGINCGIGFNLF